jgi:hypothetical protein
MSESITSRPSRSRKTRREPGRSDIISWAPCEPFGSLTTTIGSSKPYSLRARVIWELNRARISRRTSGRQASAWRSEKKYAASCARLLLFSHFSGSGSACLGLYFGTF